MAGDNPATDVEELLAQAGWLRALALRLAGDADRADDAVQETWIAAVRRPPRAGESLRPWLATVLRNALRMRARGDGRRAAREQAAIEVQGEPLTPEALVARAEAQRTLAGLVLRLEEPYRGTVLLHFFEGLSLAEIARRQGIAASTARWRLARALETLRGWLEGDFGGSRYPALAPLLALPKGALVAQKSSKLVAVLIVLLLFVGGALFVTQRGGGADAGDDGDRGRDRTFASIARGHLLGEASEEPATPIWIGQPDVALRRIAGRVTFRGAPVAGASVELASLASESGAAPPPRRTTGEDGRFDFGPRPAMEWSVRASAPGKTAAALALDLRNPVTRPPPDRLEIELGPCDAALVGTVRDASGGAIAGARVARLAGWSSSVPGGVAVETDESGRYELCVETAWPGWVNVKLSADGYGAIAYRGRVMGRVTVDFALVPEAVIVGRVVRDETGEPVPGAHVSLPRGRFATETTGWRGAFTGDDGRFRIEQVAPGRHVIRARAEGMVGPAGGAPVTAFAGRTSEEIEIRLAAGSVVRGVVLEDGEPVAGARVAAVATDGTRSPRTAVSQKDGSFALEEVPRGQVRFIARPFDLIKPETFRVERAVHDGVVLEVEPLGAITGKVVRHGRPVPEARLHVWGPNQRDLDPIYTGPDGRFEARGLEAGPWTLFGESTRHGAFGRAREIVQLDRGETEDVTIELAYGAAIAGTVLDQRGGPVPGVSVWFSHARMDDAGAAVTSSDGSFRAATMMGGGKYRVTVRPRVGSPVAFDPAPGTRFPVIELADGNAEVTGVVIAVKLERLAIEGRVVDSGGSPMADVRVVATPVGAGGEPRFLRWVDDAAAITDVEGRFSIAELEAGTYALQARSPSGVEVVNGGVRAGRTGVVLTLPAPGAIEGTVAGFRETPRVTARRLGGGPVAPAGSAAGGSFAIRDLSPGIYAVAATTATEAASAEVEVGAGATARVALKSDGSGVVIGRVTEFRSGAPVEGMTCRVGPRVGTSGTGVSMGPPARTDRRGAFVIEEAFGGDIFVFCFGLSRLNSSGLRLVELPPGGRLEIEVPVVARDGGVASELAGFGAEIDLGALVPRLIKVDPDGPAAAAGFESGDRIVAVDGESVRELSPDGVHTLITNRPPGTRVTVTVERGGRTLSGEIVLVEYRP